MPTPEQIAAWREKHGVGGRQTRPVVPGDRSVGRYGQVFAPFAERGPEFGPVESARRVFLDAPATAAQIPATMLGEALAELQAMGRNVVEATPFSGRLIDPLDWARESVIFDQLPGESFLDTLTRRRQERNWAQNLGIDIIGDIALTGGAGSLMRGGSRAPGLAPIGTGIAENQLDRARQGLAGVPGVGRFFRGPESQQRTIVSDTYTDTRPVAQQQAVPAGPLELGPARQPIALPGQVGTPTGPRNVGYGPYYDRTIVPDAPVPTGQPMLGPGVTPPAALSGQPRPMPGQVAAVKQAAIADPRIENFTPRTSVSTPLGRRAVDGPEQSAVFYRSTGTAGQQLGVVTYNPARPGAIVLSDTPQNVMGGGAVETVGLKTGSRILQQGTRDFNTLSQSGGRLRQGETSAQFIARVTDLAAKSRNYDAVRFIREGTARTLVLNEDALIRNYSPPTSRYDLLSQAGVISRAGTPGQRMLGPGQGIRPGTAATVGRPVPGEVVSSRPGVQRIAVERDPLIPYEAVGRDVLESREALRGQVSASYDQGTPVWGVTPDGEVFQFPSEAQSGVASMFPQRSEVTRISEPTLFVATDTNGDRIFVAGENAPRMSNEAKRAEAARIQRELDSGRSNTSVESAAAADQANEALEAAEIAERISTTPTVRTRPREEGTPFGDDMDSAPRKTDEALANGMDMATHEKASVSSRTNALKIGIMRKFDGARNAAGLAIEDFVLKGRQVLLQASKQGVQVNQEGMTPLFQALHGDIAADTLSPALKQMYDEIDKLRRLEEADMMAFIEKARGTENEKFMVFDLDQFKDRMLANPDYFPQMWKVDGVSVVEKQRQLSMSLRPQFTLPKSGSFSEMVAQGYTPMSWDPYKMMAMRRIAGANWRETVVFLGRSRRNGLALTADEAIKDGLQNKYRKPENVGSVFDGRLIQSGEVNGIPTTIRTPEYYLPNNMASFVETMWGKQPTAYLGDKEVIGYIRKFRNGFKSAKLFASFFQHMDISLRTAGSMLTLEGLQRGGPLRFPSLAARLLKAQWTTGYRGELRQRFLSNKAIEGHEDLGITYKMLVEEGLGVSGDITVIQREIADTLLDIERSTNPVGRAYQKLKNANEFFQSGLFEGVYREGMSWSLESFIIPAIRKQHPTWNARQVAAEAASNANLMYSSLPQWQSMLKHPYVREFGQTLFFSTNETEGLLRSFGGMFLGNNKRFWLQYYGGMMLSLAFFANLINMASTGKPLPREAYSPIDWSNPYAWTGVGYSTRFMSPQMPKWLGIQGRDGSPLSLDIVGQMDTAFRVAADPFGATSARVNVPVRALVNQWRGTNFFGEELSKAQRPGQVLTDLYGPIGLTSALGAFTEAIPALKTVMPEGEGRMGVRGQLLEGFGGVGMRAERTGDYLSRIATEVYKQDIKYSDLESHQKLDLRRLPQVATELGLRQESALRREGAETNYYANLDTIDALRTDKLQHLINRIQNGTIDPRAVSDDYYRIEAEIRGMRTQAGIAQEFDAPDVKDPDPNKRALAQLHALYDHEDVKLTGNEIDFDMFDALKNQKYTGENATEPWTQEQKEYVARNTNNRPIPSLIFVNLGPKTQAKHLLSQSLRVQFYQQMGRNDLAKASQIRFFMLDAPWTIQPTGEPAAPPVPRPAPRPPTQGPTKEQIQAWRQKHLVGVGQ